VIIAYLTKTIKNCSRELFKATTLFISKIEALRIKESLSQNG